MGFFETVEEYTQARERIQDLGIKLEILKDRYRRADGIAYDRNACGYVSSRGSATEPALLYVIQKDEIEEEIKRLNTVAKARQDVILGTIGSVVTGLPRQQMARLYYVERLSAKDIARALCYDVSSVYYNLRQAKKTIRAYEGV